MHMKNITILFAIVGSLISLQMAFASSLENLEWQGGVGVNYGSREVNDGLSAKDSQSGRDTSVQKTKTLEYRAALAAQGQVKPFDWRLGIRTKNSANNDFVLFAQNSDLTIGLESAWLKYKTQIFDADLFLTMGRQANNFWFEDISENLFSATDRFDGLGWNLEHGKFSLGFSQFVLGANNRGTKQGSSYTATDHSNSVGSTPSAIAWLVGAQPRVKWNISENIDTNLALGFYKWVNTTSFYTNTIHGGVDSVSSGASTGSVKLDNAKQFQIYNTWNFPYEIKLFGEWVKNSKQVNYTGTSIGTDQLAWVGGLQYGNLTNLHGAQATVGYTEKGLGSVVGELSSGHISPDNKGFFYMISYAAFANMQLTGKVYFLEEISDKQSNGTPSRNNQHHKTTYWVFNTNFSF